MPWRGGWKCRADGEMDLRRYDYPSARVKVFLKDGRALEESVTNQYGDFSNPATQEDLVGKFYALTVETLGDRRVGEVVDAVSRLDEMGSVRELTALLRT